MIVGYKRFFLALASVLIGATAAQASTILLPDPTSTADGGIPVAIQYDQFYSYSANLLDAMQSNGTLGGAFAGQDYQFTMGTGTLPIIVYTGANGATNPNPFEDPDAACGGNCTTFDNTASPWDYGYSGTVGALITEIGSNTPVLVFDNNQNSQGDLFGSGFIAIYDSNNNLVQQWAFDTNNNGSYDKLDTAQVCATQNIGNTATNNPPCDFAIPTAGHEYTIDNNKGSGKPDFFILPIGLDLSLFDPNDSFVVGMYLTDLDGGFEEMDIAGAQFLTVPEPATLALFGAGLLGLFGFRLMRRRAGSQ